MFDPRLGLALTAIHMHPQRHWTLQSLAAEAAMGRSSFASRFSELTATAPMQYLTCWRMQQAIVLLQSSSMGPAEISERCGYESEPAFSKAFRNTIGKPSGAFRSRNSTTVTQGLFQ
ncbi:MAG: AraC-like DNA-binding protein [Halioglobus sp.]|jgi:AraC-like DNA-binding protein